MRLASGWINCQKRDKSQMLSEDQARIAGGQCGYFSRLRLLGPRCWIACLGIDHNSSADSGRAGSDRVDCRREEKGAVANAEWGD